MGDSSFASRGSGNGNCRNQAITLTENLRAYDIDVTGEICTKWNERESGTVAQPCLMRGTDGTVRICKRLELADPHVTLKIAPTVK
jgi:hypothetical protein